MFCANGCSNDDLYVPAPSTTPRCLNTPKKFLVIETYYTESVEGGKKFNFAFYGCFNSTGSLPIKLKVVGGYNGGCISYQNLKFASINSGVTTNYVSLTAPSDFLSGCNSKDRHYTVYASVEGGDTTRAIEPLIISPGNPPGYTPEAKVEYSITYFKNPMIVNPDDSLVISGNINKYGIHLAGNYFDMEGYLNPGKYRIFVSRILNGSSLISDRVDFEIHPLNDEDRIVLDLVQNETFIQIMKNYQNSPFYESVNAFYVLKSFRPKFAESYVSLNEILNTYQNFSSRFPNSFSWYDASFIFVSGFQLLNY